MDRLDLEAPMFSQGDVLKMLPRLSPKSLQNWASRGASEGVEKQTGRRAKRRYTPAGVIMLSFMADATALGLPPSIARRMAEDIAWAAVDLWALKLERPDAHGIPVITEYNLCKDYRTAYIFKVDEPDWETYRTKDGFVIRFWRDDYAHKNSYVLPSVHLAYKADALAISRLNLMHYHLAGKEWRNRLVDDIRTPAERKRDWRAYVKALRTLGNT